MNILRDLTENQIETLIEDTYPDQLEILYSKVKDEVKKDLSERMKEERNQPQYIKYQMFKDYIMILKYRFKEIIGRDYFCIEYITFFSLSQFIL